MAHSERHFFKAFPLSDVTSVLSNEIEPLVGSTSLLIILSNVDFPAPDFPIMPTISPWVTSSVMPLTAIRPSVFFPNCFIKEFSRSDPIFFPIKK